MRESRSGFTLVEVLTLVGILGVLAALVLVLMPEPVVHVHVQMPEKAETPPVSVTIAPKEMTIAPESLVIAPKSVTIAPDAEITIAPKSLTLAPEEMLWMEPPESPREADAGRRPMFEAAKIDCMNHVRMLVGLLEASGSTKYPKYAGPNLLLYLVKKGEIVGRDLEILFCPGDMKETLEKAGGVRAYRDIDLSKREYDHMTSYAGRDQLDAECRAVKGAPTPQVLLCDDSEDHHDGRGIVVGLTGGAVKWRDRARDYGNAAIAVGEGSEIEELRCLRAE